MARKVGIIGYGTMDDRIKLEMLANLSRKSASAWLIDKIRSEYRESFGSMPPPIDLEDDTDDSKLRD